MRRPVAPLAALVALATLLLPTAAQACPVCGQGAPGTESALLVMSGILSALPLLMAGGIVAWIVVRARAAEGGSASQHGLAHPDEERLGEPGE